jgi:hypothetical protein
MAIKEGRCPNCGSILQLEGNAQKGHCIFCDMVFPNEQAFSLAESSKGVVFPNLPQPKYTGPNLDVGFAAAAPSAQRQKQLQPQKKVEKKPIPPVYIPKEPVKLPDMKLPAPLKRRILLITLAAVLVLSGIFVPLFIQRDNVRTKVLGEMTQIAPFEVDTQGGVAIRGLRNASLMIASKTAVSQADMVRLFTSYCEARAAAMKIDLDNFNAVYRSVTVKLVTEQGGYVISRPESQAALDSGEAIVTLP